MEYKLPRLNPELFTWQLWRAGSIKDLTIVSRYNAIMLFKYKIIRAAIGYCYGHELLCRPKPKEIAIMYFTDGTHWWSRLRQNEFNEIFGR